MNMKIANNMMDSINAGNVTKRPVVSAQHPEKMRNHTIPEPAETSPGSMNENQDAQSSREQRSAEDVKMLESILEQIKEELKTDEHEVAFSYNDSVRQMVVTVTNKKNGEVIRQIPEEYVLRLFEKFHISGTVEGVLINDKV